MNVPITHMNCLRTKFPTTRTSATQKELFPNYLCNHFGIIVLDKIIGPMGALFVPSIGLGFGTQIGRAQVLPVSALDKNQSHTGCTVIAGSLAICDCDPRYQTVIFV